jgi:hypothetical protein
MDHTSMYVVAVVLFVLNIHLVVPIVILAVTGLVKLVLDR